MPQNYQDITLQRMWSFWFFFYVCYAKGLTNSVNRKHFQYLTPISLMFSSAFISTVFVTSSLTFPFLFGWLSQIMLNLTPFTLFYLLFHWSLFCQSLKIFILNLNRPPNILCRHPFTNTLILLEFLIPSKFHMHTYWPIVCVKYP